MAISKSASKIKKFYVLQNALKIKILKFVGIVFVSSICSCVITELSIIIAKHFPFLQEHVEGFQI